MNNKEELKNILDIYDISQTLSKKYLSHKNVTIDDKNNQIIMHFANNDEVFDCEFAGYYDNDTKLWYWAWVLPNITCSETSLSNQIINYGIKLNNNDPSSLEYLYKLLFINPIIKLKNNIELDNHIAVIHSILRNRIKFIYYNKVYLDPNKKKYIINYYYILV